MLCGLCGKEFKPAKRWLNKPKWCSDECRLIAWCLKKAKKMKKELKKVIGVFVFFSLFFSADCFASTPAYFNKVVDAIYKAEGAPKAKVPYGILSVKVSSKAEARKVCYNTVKNNWGRWEKAGRPGCYLSFLANRYCPVGAENDNGTNKFWQKNVEAFLK